MTRKAPVPKQTIVVSNNRPKITITSYDDLIRVVVPGVHRQALALAHAIVCGFLGEISDEQNQQIHAPKIEPGDARLTCLVIAIELQRYGVNPASKASPSVRRTKLAFLSKTLREVTRRACSPLYGGQAIYDVVEVIA